MRNWTGLAAAPLLLVGVAGCDLLGSKKAEEKDGKAATTKVASAASRLCAANATYTRLKESAFDEAKRIRERDTEALDALADASVVRMEDPLLESRDEALGLTVCSGRMIVELPPGAGAAFNGRQRLAADITYSAQAAADGSGTVYKIDGGEPIVYRLAAFDPSGATRTASIEPLGIETPPAAADEPDVITSTPAPRVAPPVPQPRTPPPPAPRTSSPPRPAPEPATVKPDPATERARRLAAAERATRAAAGVREERAAAAAAAAERRARAERIAAAQRDERGGEAEEVRPTRTARAPAAARPSFNCRYARSRVEKMVCGDPDLAARDRRMAALYYRTNASSDPVVRRRLSASRLRFLAYRDRCPNEACVAAAYEDRIDEINDLADQ